MKKDWLEAENGFTYIINKVHSLVDLPNNTLRSQMKEYTKLYKVFPIYQEKVVLYIGYDKESREYHAFYNNDKMWISYGKTIKATIRGAIADAINYL